MQNLQKNINVFKNYMSNLFIAENFKTIIKTLPILKIQMHQNEISFVVEKKHIMQVLAFFKNHIKYQFKILTCISGVDYPFQKYRFKVVYELLSVRYNIRIRVKILTNELMPIESCCEVFAAAGWYESEIWDLYGIFFTSHRNLTRLLTDYGFEGYPLRKDFPLSGFVESSYNWTGKRVTSERVELSQEYRALNFTSPWDTFELN